jgi:group I intron endonuclease
MGSSHNIEARFKYHYYNGKYQKNFLGIFLNAFGWSSFSFTLVEECFEDQLKSREDWYLHRYKPILNYLTFSYRDPRQLHKMSPITKSKISLSLRGKKMTLETRMKMSISKSGSKN